jgi:hypothetical protein
VIVVAGPDGTGKSTLCDAIEREVFPGVPVLRVHHRPGVLPYSKGPKAPITEPHRDPPYGALKSFGKAVFLWADFVLGWFLRFRPFVRDGGWVIMERGWWDMVVDPRRYRLDTTITPMRALGRSLPCADVTVVLEAPVDVIRDRKSELPDEELERQMRAWRELPIRARRTFLDASRPADELVDRVGQLVRGRGIRLAARQPGWVALPHRTSPRWLLPRAPRAVARASLLVYHPVTASGLVGWRSAHLVARGGGFHLLPRSDIDGMLPDVVYRHVPPHCTIAVARANHPGRFVVLVIAPDGTHRAALKIATTDQGLVLLEKEREALGTFGRHLPLPLRAPRVLAYEEGLLSLEPVPWQPRTKAWRLDAPVCVALGEFFSHMPGRSGIAAHAAHGDCAPWNLLRTRQGWTVIDWEDAFVDAPPFYDVFSYLVQAHTLLHHPTLDELRAGVAGAGWIGAAIDGFASGSGVRRAEAKRFFVEYLERSLVSLDPSRQEASVASASRRRLLEAFGS